MKCPNVSCEGGTVTEVRTYTSPPPGDRVFEKDYASLRGGFSVTVARNCLICGGRGEVPDPKEADDE